MKDPDRLRRLFQKVKPIQNTTPIEFVMLDLEPLWMKCRRTKRLVFQFHKLGSAEGKTACNKTLKEYQILPDRQEKMVITQVNLMLGGLGLLVFFDLCPQCFNNLNRCRPLE